MKTYQISPGSLKTFSVPGKPFLSFDQFLNVVQWYRDYHYAAENVERFSTLAGKEYSVWTVRQNSSYFRHVWLEQLSSDLKLSFEVLPLVRNATFSLQIELSGPNGELYFSHFQELAVERLGKNGFVLTSWRRVPEIRDFLLSEAPVLSDAA